MNRPEGVLVSNFPSLIMDEGVLVSNTPSSIINEGVLETNTPSCLFMSGCPSYSAIIGTTGLKDPVRKQIHC